jgi:hypothetical protein
MSDPNGEPLLPSVFPVGAGAFRSRTPTEPPSFSPANFGSDVVVSGGSCRLPLDGTPKARLTSASLTRVPPGSGSVSPTEPRSTRPCHAS